MPELVHLIYVSSFTCLLLYSDGNFMQAIEGATQEVDALFSRILKDPRHTGLIRLGRQPIDQRCFPDWPMGFNCISDIQVEGFSVFLNSRKDHRILACRAKNLLKGFMNFQPSEAMPPFLHG